MPALMEGRVVSREQPLKDVEAMQNINVSLVVIEANR